MDPEHRHDLKRNPLEEMLLNPRQWWEDRGRDWWQRHGTKLLLTVVLLLLAILGVNWFSGRQARLREAAYTELAAATSPIAKQDVANQYERVPGLAGLALLEAGDMVREEALFGGAPADPFGAPIDPPDAEQRRSLLERAARLYERVIELDQAPLQVLNARLGLAAVHESLGDFDAARQQYELLRQRAADTWPTLAKQAEQKLATLDRIAEPVRFVEAPAPEASPLGDEDLPFTLPSLDDPPPPPAETPPDQTPGEASPDAPSSDTSESDTPPSAAPPAPDPGAPDTSRDREGAGI